MKNTWPPNPQYWGLLADNFSRIISHCYIIIFNCSYYEDVLVVRVYPEFLAKQKLPTEARGKDIWKRRFEQTITF